MGFFTVDGSGEYASLNAAIAVCSGGEIINTNNSWSADDTTNVEWDVAVIVTVTGVAKNQNGYPGRANGSYQLVGVSGTSAGHLFTVTADVDISDMDIAAASSEISSEIFRCTTHSLDIKRCYIGWSTPTSQQDVVYSDDDTTCTPTYSFESCMFYDVHRTLVDLWDPRRHTTTVNFNSCSGYNISIESGRSSASWVGQYGNYGDQVLEVNFFNCLLQSSGGATYLVAFTSDPVVTVNAECNITNLTSANFSTSNAFYTENFGTDGEINSFSATWTESDPDGDVGLNDISAAPYDQTLYDPATDNLAKRFHSDGSGSNSELSIPTGGDILGNEYLSPYCIGAFAVQPELIQYGETSGIEAVRLPNGDWLITSTGPVAADDVWELAYGFTEPYVPVVPTVSGTQYHVVVDSATYKLIFYPDQGNRIRLI